MGVRLAVAAFAPAAHPARLPTSCQSHFVLTLDTRTGRAGKDLARVKRQVLMFGGDADEHQVLVGVVTPPSAATK